MILIYEREKEKTLNYDTATIKDLIKLAKAREVVEAYSFLLELLETLVPEKEFKKFLLEIER